MQDKLCQRFVGGLLGVCIGDALGVPVEFSFRSKLEKNPVTDFIGYGIYNQPPGTYSDDGALTLVTAEAFLEGYDLERIAKGFVKWYTEGYWSARGKVFDVGMTTEIAIESLKNGTPPDKSGLDDECSNGNGSLMRILPVALYSVGLTDEEAFKMAHETSAITHAHPRSQMACGIYVQLVRRILEGKDPTTAYHKTIEVCLDYYDKQSPFSDEIEHFKTFFSGNLAKLPPEKIKSSGYVVDTLNASVWAFLNGKSFEKSVLKAVNLGEDTDTVGAVTGGLCGVFYGVNGIPPRWIENLAKSNEIKKLALKLCQTVLERRMI